MNITDHHKKYKLLLIVVVQLLYGHVKAQDNKLWYNQPAKVWTEALPIGNGRLGAMVFGKVDDEFIQLNEASLWSGGPVKDNVNPAAFSYLAKVRSALFKGDFQQAHELEKQMQGVYSESYLPLADFHIRQQLGEVDPGSYDRDLNIQDAIATTTFKVKGVRYKREVFVSAPDQVIVIRITCDKPRQITLKLGATSQLHFKTELLNDNILALKGKAPVHVDPNYVDYKKEPIIYDDKDTCNGMRYEMLTKVLINDGKMTADSNSIAVKGASVVTIYISAATSFNGYNKCPVKDEHQIALNYLMQATNKPYRDLLNSHLADFHQYFNRVSLSLNHNKGSRTDLPTDARLENYLKTNSDPGLEALYFQYGRYLLISSSRTPGIPANLQGIWNKELRPPWSSNYTSNINVQMNYWMAEDGNLSEMHQPLFDLIKELSVTGSNVASEFYHTRGWVVHHNTDIWALANPVGDFGHGDPKWANWPMGGDWLCRHLWEHYLFTRDKQFLKETAYPLMKGAAKFTLDWLVPDGNGHLVTSPSMSPENDFIYDGGKVADVSISSTMDMGIIRDLFDNLIEGSEILNIDPLFRDTLIAKRKLLIPFQIGSKGQLQEWFKDYESPDPHHRHVSHLYSVFPAHLISLQQTPALAVAAKRSLILRGDESTGWSLAWKVNLWARLQDGNHAYRLYRDLLRITKENGYDYNEGGGLYANMFDAHPPFQIDGNFGGASGLIEMLLQSQDGNVHLLPALPDAWASGSFKGLVARGNFVIDLSWDHKKIEHATVYARNGGVCRILSNSPLMIEKTKTVAVKKSNGYELVFNTHKNSYYQLTSIK